MYYFIVEKSTTYRNNEKFCRRNWKRCKDVTADDRQCFDDANEHTDPSIGNSLAVNLFMVAMFY